jgi:hypothetical protein
VKVENTSLRVGDILTLIGVFATFMIVWNIIVTRRDNKTRDAQLSRIKEQEEENTRREKEVRSFVKIEEQIANINGTMIRIEAKIDKDGETINGLIAKHGVIDNKVEALHTRFDKFEAKCQNIQDNKLRAVVERLG